MRVTGRGDVQEKAHRRSSARLRFRRAPSSAMATGSGASPPSTTPSSATRRQSSSAPGRIGRSDRRRARCPAARRSSGGDGSPESVPGGGGGSVEAVPRRAVGQGTVVPGLRQPPCLIGSRLWEAPLYRSPSHRGTSRNQTSDALSSVAGVVGAVYRASHMVRCFGSVADGSVSVSIAMSAVRARATRERTVPMGQPTATAASA